MKAILLYSLILFSCTTRNNSSIERENRLNGKVIKIVDGDTFDLLTDDKVTFRIRMNSIDCPERKQDYYQICKNTLGAYIFGKNVSVITHGTDRYRRTIADVFYKNENINLKMIQNGFAWHYIILPVFRTAN